MKFGIPAAMCSSNGLRTIFFKVLDAPWCRWSPNLPHSLLFEWFPTAVDAETPLEAPLFRLTVHPDINHVPIRAGPFFAPILHYIQHCVQHVQAANFCWLSLFRKTFFDCSYCFSFSSILYIITISALCEQPLGRFAFLRLCQLRNLRRHRYFGIVGAASVAGRALL